MKSPLKSKPLRNPGESLDEEINNVLLDDALPYCIVSIFVIVLAGLEWWRWYSELPPAPIIYSILAVLSVLVSTWKVRQAMARVKRLKLGRDGEKIVSEFLERLREDGARIFHDIPGEGFNLDHVVVHRTSLYVIETKTLSKREHGENKLVYDGESILNRGIKPDRNPITQVRAANKWLSELVRESTGRNFPVKSVVLYPGRYIESTARAKTSDVWVLNPKVLPAFIAKERERMSAEDVNLCAYHIDRYVRVSQT